MASWKLRLQKYNEQNNIVTFQNGGDNETDYTIPNLNSEYYNTITLNNKVYSLDNKNTIKMIKKIINYYEQKY